MVLLAKYAGKRARFSAVTRAEGVGGGAQLMMHVNREKGRLTESVRRADPGKQ